MFSHFILISSGFFNANSMFSSFIDGFFDAGMLLNALKASESKHDDSRRNSDVVRRREIGRRLVIAEY